MFLISGIAPGVMAPAHATVDSILAKFRMPGTSCLTTCALAAVAARQTAMASSAGSGALGCMPHLLYRAQLTTAGAGPALLVNFVSRSGGPSQVARLKPSRSSAASTDSDGSCGAAGP